MSHALQGADRRVFACVEQVWYLSYGIPAIGGGLLSFGAVFVEMFFILSSIWQVRSLLRLRDHLRTAESMCCV